MLDKPILEKLIKNKKERGKWTQLLRPTSTNKYCMCIIHWQVKERNNKAF